jgi:hypothetical protein
VSDVQPQGWYHDSYGIHEARWFSNGLPTSLVRDGDTESQDPPPSGPPPRRPDPLEEVEGTETPTRPGFFENLVDVVISVIP